MCVCVCVCVCVCFLGGENNPIVFRMLDMYAFILDIEHSYYLLISEKIS